MQASANVAASHDVTASPAPDEGAAFSRRRTPGEGLRQRSLEQGQRPARDVVKNRHVERREGERAFAKARGHLSQEVPLFRAVSALRSLI